MRQVIPPTAESRHRAALPPLPVLPTREQIAAARGRVVHSNRGHGADLIEIDAGQGPLLVKDFSGKPWWSRWLGRIEIGHECRAYRRLAEFEGLGGIPRFIGRVDAHALAVEMIDGELLAHAPNRVSEGCTHVERLRVIMDRLHAAGFLHLDLRSNKNVLLASDGRIVLLDFASSLWFRPGSFAHRTLFSLLQVNDVSGYLKWKQTLSAGPPTPEETAVLARHRWMRPLWLLNDKRRRADR